MWRFLSHLDLVVLFIVFGEHFHVYVVQLPANESNLANENGDLSPVESCVDFLYALSCGLENTRHLQAAFIRHFDDLARVEKPKTDSYCLSYGMAVIANLEP